MECHHAFCPRFPMVLPKVPQGFGHFCPTVRAFLPIRMSKFAHPYGLKSLNHNMKAASIVNEAYCVEQGKRLRKQLKPIVLFSY